MQTITVRVEQSAAIERGSAQWGDRPIDLEAVLAELSAEEREQLHVDSDSRLRARCASANNNSGRPYLGVLEVPSTEINDVLDAIREGLATVQGAREEIDARIVEAAELYLAGGGRHTLRGSAADLERLGLGYQVASEDDRREQLHVDDCAAWTRQAIEALDADTVIAHETPAGKCACGSDRRELATTAGLADEYSAALVAHEGRLEAVAQTREAAVLEWARGYGSADLCRAIDEGYPVGKRPQTEVREWARGLLAGIEDTTILDAPCETGERTVPSAGSYTARDRVVAYAGGLYLPDGCRIEIGRIMRITYTEYVDCTSEYHSECDDDGKIPVERKRTGVVVTVRLPWGDEAITVVFSEDGTQSESICAATSSR